MKHCHFTILCNELACLKQKLPFLYKHFDQLIFYDLHINTFEFSSDGSHEYIRDFPDPEGKITLIEERGDARLRRGKVHGKQSMFEVGSGYVRNDMDAFWCTDADEFFRLSLIPKVESVLRDTNANTILVPHLIFFRNERWVFVSKETNSELVALPYPRIARHMPGNLYGHCNLQAYYPPTRKLQDELLYHFAYVGLEKMGFKASVHISREYYEQVFCKFDESKVGHPPGGMYGYPEIHPARTFGIRPNTHAIPDYIDVDTLMRELETGV